MIDVLWITGLFVVGIIGGYVTGHGLGYQKAWLEICEHQEEGYRKISALIKRKRESGENGGNDGR